MPFLVSIICLLIIIIFLGYYNKVELYLKHKFTCIGKQAIHTATAIKDKIFRIGELQIYFFRVLKLLFHRPFRKDLILQQATFLGAQSLNIVILSGFFTGAVFGLQIGGIFEIFRSESLMGGATGIALATELAPLVTGFLLAGKAGSAITAEIATMVVNEQIDAMEAMGIDPMEYLVRPRVIASLFTMPLLCGVFMFVGIVGAYIVGEVIFYVDQGLFIDKLVKLLTPHDVVVGLRKMTFFAFIISALACRKGLTSKGGAKGVGLSTTQAVISMLIFILFTDFVLSFLEVRWLS